MENDTDFGNDRPLISLTRKLVSTMHLWNEKNTENTENDCIVIGFSSELVE